MKTKIILMFGLVLIIGNCRSAPPTGGVKVSLPLELELEYNEAGLAAGSQVPFNVRVKLLEDVYQIGDLVETQGAIQIRAFNDTERKHPSVGEEFLDEGVFQIVGEGMGELSVSVIAYGEAGQKLYGRSITHYFWVTSAKVYVGDNGVMELKLKALNDDLDSGLINSAEYQETRESILGGGAIESIKIMTPTP